ncbi:hypothetical protein BHF71_01055 [Vulcanibacillus modesticaldus]|uniref:SLH domain-containing protein n=1 Tax=Vulcanibacillus modesticaldus TaxID=337097 RepID=A0A1D2YVQ3_9BACI|nr:S-layer homology domain-containing protein [Vulcanibacillus modesticaldus]OEF99794.1 hypothetical protein BHF71_01055 [Vulcanibacillus modesticaldus]
MGPGRKLLTIFLAIILALPLSLGSLSSTYVVNAAAEDYVNQVISAYGALSDEELAQVRAVRDAIKQKDWSWWKDTVIADEEFNTKLTQLYPTDETPVYTMISDFVQLFYTADDLQATVDSTKAKHTATFQTLFGSDFTFDDLLDFFGELQNQAALNFFIGSLFNDSYTVNDAITDAITDTFATGNYDLFEGKLSELGLSVTDLIRIKDNFQTALIDEGVPVIEARNAVIGGFARVNSDIVFTNEQPTIGSTQQLSYSVSYPFAVTLNEGLDYYSSDSSVATVTLDGFFQAVSEGTTTITVAAKGIIVGLKEITVTAPPSSGGGGGIISIPGGSDEDEEPVTEPQEPVDEGIISEPTTQPIDVAESVTITEDDETGLTITSATVNEENVLSQIAGTDQPADIRVEITNDSDLFNVEFSSDFIAKTDADNTNNRLSVISKLGSTTVSVKDINATLTALKDKGIDLEQGKVTISFGKASATIKQAISDQITSNGAKVLSEALETKVMVVVDEESYPVKNVTNYIKSKITIDQMVDIKKVVAVEWKHKDDNVSKSIIRMASPDGELTSVPTLVEISEGKTIITVKQRTFAPIMVVENDKTFSDVSDSFWGKDDINLLASKMIVKGRAEDRFEPNGKITRAEFATMIVRALGLNKTMTTDYKDVKANAWFTGYIGAASKAGIVNGMGDGTFKPNLEITREQAATMIIRTIEYLGGNITLSDEEKTKQLAKFNDSSQIKAWAVDYVAKSAKVGIILGDDKQNFNPAANTTRAESVAMLKRFMKITNLLSE